MRHKRYRQIKGVFCISSFFSSFPLSFPPNLSSIYLTEVTYKEYNAKSQQQSPQRYVNANAEQNETQSKMKNENGGGKGDKRYENDVTQSVIDTGMVKEDTMMKSQWERVAD